MPSHPAPPPPAPSDLEERLERWVAAGLIRADQADRIRAAERPAPAPEPPRAVSLVAEALGYVGGVLVLVAAVTLTGRLWDELGTGGRLAVALGATAVLLGAGAAAPVGAAAGRRLRAVCWLIGVATLAFATALVGEDLLDLDGDGVALLTSAVAAAAAGGLWAAHRTVVQQAAVVLPLAVGAGAAAAHLPAGADTVTGLAVWGTGLVWLLLGRGGVITARPAATVLGGTTAVVGAQLTVDTDGGAVLAVLTALALVAGGVVLRDLLLLVLGAAAVLVTVPTVLSRWFPDALSVPLVLLAAGTLLVVGALWAARRGTVRPVRRPAELPPRLAVIVAAAVGLAVAVAVVVLGLAG